MRQPFPARRAVTTALVSATLLGVSGVAFAVVQSVDSSPQPQVVIPSSATVGTEDHSASGARDDRSRAPEVRQGADDPATHDAHDDHGADDPATHDARDDDGSDDPATHDDHGRHGRDG